MCKYDIWNAFQPVSGSRQLGQQSLETDEANDTRLNPITNANPGYGATGISDLINTRNRYSWLCSLQLKSELKSHICGVTLLSMPPSQTVLISAAHCVTVCRSEAMNKVLPNCCCDNIGGEICDDPDNECGDDPEIVNMTGEDAEIICGEWETGPTPASESGEEYNIILPIKKIIKHPNYTISRGEQNSQFVANDLAVFIVDDEELKNYKDRVVPICLPSGNHSSPTNAIHAGWSSPPPLEFLNATLPNYVPYFKEFYKAWHYQMTLQKCSDPDEEYKFKSQSYYPPGVTCAVEKFNEFCPSSGESGSPLMVKENNRFIVHGLQSFIKGCSKFNYIGGNKLIQESTNPSVYVKVSCFLPWIAEQYGMDYIPEDNIDPDCVIGNGNINEITAEVCTTIPTTYLDKGQLLTDNIEARCIFPYVVDDQAWDECRQSGIQDFTHPVFKCPNRSIKHRNSTYFTGYITNGGEVVNEIVNAVYCPTNSIGAENIIFNNISNLSTDNDEAVVTYFFNEDGPVFGENGEYELDPDNDQCQDNRGRLVRLPVFGTCKNNCKGGKLK